MEISKRDAKERWRSSTSKRNNDLQLLNKLQYHLLSNTACTTGKECSHTLVAATTARDASVDDRKLIRLKNYPT